MVAARKGLGNVGGGCGDDFHCLKFFSFVWGRNWNVFIYQANIGFLHHRKGCTKRIFFPDIRFLLVLSFPLAQL